MEKVSYSGDRIGRRIFAKAKKLEGFEFERKKISAAQTSDPRSISDYGFVGTGNRFRSGKNVGQIILAACKGGMVESSTQMPIDIAD
jgi:hypothetical protein